MIIREVVGVIAMLRQPLLCETMLMLREGFMRTFRAGLILLTLAVAPFMAEGNQQATMHGVVTGKEGRPVQSAFVLVRDYQQSSQDTQKWETRTAGDGSFSVSRLRGGGPVGG